MTVYRFPLDETLGILGRAACDAELNAADETLSIGTRDGFRTLAGKLREMQFETLGDYELANVLCERKNVSRIPSAAWVAVRSSLIGMGLFAAFAGLVWLGLWMRGCL